MYDKNLEVLMKFHPEAAKQIDHISGLSFDVRLSGTGIYNLYVKNSNGDIRACYSEPDPLADLGAVVELMKDKAGYAVCMFGAGLCIHIKALISRLEGNYLIVLMEAHPEILKAAMSVSDLTDVFSHPGIRIVTGGSKNLHELFAGQEAKLFSARGYSVIDFPGVTALAPEWYDVVKESVHQLFIKRKEDAKVLEYAGDALFKNRFKNLYSMATSKSANILKNRHKDVPIILVASGPSLEKNIEALRDVKGAVIIAVDSAVAPLMKHSIKPDYIVTADFRAMTYEKLAPYADDLSDVKLVFFSEATPIIPAYIHFSEMFYFFLNSNSTRLFERLLEKECLAIPSAQSVIHGAICIAQWMGGSPIIFTGLDLAFSGAKDHADGTVLHWGNVPDGSGDVIMVEGIDGKMIRSMPGFIAQKEICEQLILDKPEITYIDASEGGLKISGTDVLPLAEVITTYCLNRSGIEHFKEHDSAVVVRDSLLPSLVDLQKENLGVKKSLEHYFEHFNGVRSYLAENPGLVSLNAFKGTIKEKIRKMDAINTALNDNRLIKSLKELQGKSYQEYLAHSFDETNVDEFSNAIKQLVLDIRQQGFVQQSRLDAVGYFSKLVNEQIELFSGLNQIENNTELEAVAKKMKLGEYLFKHEFLSKAESLFSELAGLPDADYYLGIIKIKKGQIESGKKQIESAVLQKESLREQSKKTLSQIVDSLLNKTSDGVYQDIIIEKVLTLEPGNLKALEIRQEHNLHEATTLIHSGKLSTAEALLFSAWNPGIALDLRYSVLLLLLCIQQLKYNKAIIIWGDIFLEKKGDYFVWFRYWTDQFGFLDTEWIDTNGLPKLVDFVEKKPDGEYFLQAVWEAAWHTIEKNFLMFEGNETVVDYADKELEKWVSVKTIIPEWCAINSMKYFVKNDFSNALESIGNAIDIGEKITSVYGNDYLLYIKTRLYLEINDNEAVNTIQTALNTTKGIHWWIISLLVLLNKNEGNEVEKQIEAMDSLFSFECNLPYYNEIKRVKEKKKLKPLLAEVAVSCCCPIKGERLIASYCFIESVNPDDFTRLTKNIIFGSDFSLNSSETPLLNEFINRIWLEDVNRIKAGEASNPEKLLKNWQSFYEILFDWGRFNADFYLANNQKEKALQGLDFSLEKNINNIEFLKFYILQLFPAGRTDDAIDVFNRLIEINPDSVSLLKEVADNFAVISDYSSALAVYEECLALMPDNYEVLYGIGDVYYKTGNYDAAALAIETLLLNTPEHISACSLLQKIKNSQ